MAGRTAAFDEDLRFPEAWDVSGFDLSGKWRRAVRLSTTFDLPEFKVAGQDYLALVPEDDVTFQFRDGKIDPNWASYPCQGLLQR